MTILRKSRNSWLKAVLALCCAVVLHAQEPTAYITLPANVWEKVYEDCNFPEGPAWDGKRLYFSNCYGGWIGYTSQNSMGIWSVGQDSPFTYKKTNGLRALPNGSIVGCEYSKGFIFTITADKKFSVLSSGWEGKAFNRPNDLCLDADGNIYFTDPKTYNKDTANGRVFVIDKKGNTLLAYSGLCFPNGIAVSPDGKYVYVCESANQRIVRLSRNKDLTLSSPEQFAAMPGGDPDGIEFDGAGRLIAAHFGGGAVYVFNSNGSIAQKISTPGKKPTNIELAGGWLYLTEAETNAVYRVKYPAGE